MAPGTGRNGDLREVKTGFIYECGVFLFHTDGATSAADIAGKL